MSIKTPNYSLTVPFNASKTGQDNTLLPAGAFVRPIDSYYLPQHIKDAPYHKFFDPDTEVYCYTRVGILPIPKNIIRET